MEVHFTCMSVASYLGTSLSVSRRSHSNGLRVCNVSPTFVLRNTHLLEVSTRLLELTKFLTQDSCSGNLSSTIQIRVIQNFWWNTTDSERVNEGERDGKKSAKESRVNFFDAFETGCFARKCNSCFLCCMCLY